MADRAHPDPVPSTTLVLIGVIGVAIGFLGGLLGKGGSAIATPMLHAIGVPAAVALAAPLPATIPATLLSGAHYARAGEIDRRLIRLTILAGIPATALGAFATRWVDPGMLVGATDVVLVALGVRIVVAGHRARSATAAATRPAGPVSIVTVAAMVGLVSGLLANSGGFLLAPLFVTALSVPLRRALGSSLIVAAALAVPGTIVHAALGHIDWTVVAIFAATTIPASSLGARTALRTDPRRLEAVYGAALVALGTTFLAIR